MAYELPEGASGYLSGMALTLYSNLISGKTGSLVSAWEQLHHPAPERVPMNGVTFHSSQENIQNEILYQKVLM